MTKKREAAAIRLAKLLAQRGIASRRKAEEMIASGQVSVNGVVVTGVTLVDPAVDIVEVRGERIPAEPPKRYYLLNKPRGYITGRGDPRGRKGVLDLVKGLPVRVEPVGRLDYDTEGALLLTNDGQLAHDLTHPSREVPKTYLAVVEGVPNRADLKAIREGIPLDDGLTAPAQALVIGTERGNSLLEVTVIEGRNRLIRRMMKQLGHAVLELRRERFGSISIDGLAKGQLRPLTDEEVRELRALAMRKPKR
ncbi:MAG: pseudouridine synthase [Dehalococcoidia bacterium]